MLGISKIIWAMFLIILIWFLGWLFIGLYPFQIIRMNVFTIAHTENIHRVTLSDDTVFAGDTIFHVGDLVSIYRDFDKFHSLVGDADFSFTNGESYLIASWKANRFSGYNTRINTFVIGQNILSGTYQGELVVTYHLFKGLREETFRFNTREFTVINPNDRYKLKVRL